MGHRNNSVKVLFVFNLIFNCPHLLKGAVSGREDHGMVQVFANQVH